MRPFASLVLLGFATCLHAAPVPKELRAPSDAEKLQGVWVVVQGEPGSKGYFWTFAGGTVLAGGTPTAKGLEYDFVIRPAESPREMDIGGHNRFSYQGIYKFVGDELHLAYQNNGRPTDFSVAGGRHIDVLRRFVEVKK